MSPVTILEIDGEDNYFLLQKTGVEDKDTLHNTIHLPLIDCLNFVFGILKLLLNQIRKNGVCKIAKPIIHHLTTRILGSSRVILLKILEMFF